jgi:predicted  nucleic acid-binding Zn-ribbon protein
VSDLLAYARELEAEDAALAEAIAGVEELGREAVDVRARAVHAAVFLAALPQERAAAAAALEEAQVELERRLAEAREAEAQLERAEKEEAVLAARRAVVRTHDLAGGAERKVARLRAAAGELEEEARAVEVELLGLHRRAADLAGRLAGVRRVGDVGTLETGPAGAEAWAARAEAALFVARSGLETERERVIRQANELAASVLGEPLAASRVSVVRERLERQS